jgi:tetratricopeptide (TPR) repeat protein
MRQHRSILAICFGREVARLRRKRLCAQRRALIRYLLKLGTIFPICWTSRAASEAAIDCLRSALRVAPDYADAIFNLALLLQRNNQHVEAAEYWRRYLGCDPQSDWAARARRSLKFCEMQVHLSAS